MKYIIFGFLALTLSISLSGCKPEAQTVVVAGDSWGFFVCANKSFVKPFANAGLTTTKVNSTCLVTTRVGMHAEDWLGSNFHKATQTALLDATVKVLYLSLGGNDLMNDWNKNMPATERAATFLTIRNRVQNIIAKYRKQRPDIKILISGYDFPRFTPDHVIPDYKEAFEAMGSPTPFELNGALQEFSASMASLADGSNVFYIQHLGLMHYYFGNRDAGLPAFQTLPPTQISSPDAPTLTGGDLRLQTDPEGMLKVEGLAVDAFHLSKSGYEKIADHSVQHYLKSWLLPPKTP